MHHRLFLVGLWLATASANTEKAIFVAPEPVNLPSTHPNLDDLHVHTLTPGRWAVRTHVVAQFPSTASPSGKATWLVLDELTEGQRYEVRVCWAATQPTAFALNHYELHTVFETPELITELSDYSWSRRPVLDGPGQEHAEAQRRPAAAERTASVLLLQILAAADYYTTNKTLMSDVPPVYVDIILDPYVFNLLPRSLLPTIGYIVVVAVLSWFLAWRVASWVRTVAMEPDRSKKEQ